MIKPAGGLFGVRKQIALVDLHIAVANQQVAQQPEDASIS
jgi:hypothetical protein